MYVIYILHFLLVLLIWSVSVSKFAVSYFIASCWRVLSKTILMKTLKFTIDIQKGLSVDFNQSSLREGEREREKELTI